MSKRYRLLVVSLVAVCLILGWGTAAFAQLEQGTMTHDGYTRTYLYYVPSSYDGSEPVPLLFSFHGLGSDAQGQFALTRFDLIAEQEGFIAVFPDCLDPEQLSFTGDPGVQLPALPGADRQWNIGIPMSLQYAAGVDDVGFIEALINEFKANYNINEDMIYATGMSNGAMFTYYVAMGLPDQIAGIGAVTSPMISNVAADGFGRPLTVVLMMGDQDPVVNYEGDSVTHVYLSAEDTIDYCVAANNISGPPEEFVWGPTDADPTRIVRRLYSGGVNGTKVVFYKMEGAGHTWPCGPQYADPAAIGLVSKHISASAQLWADLSGTPVYITGITPVENIMVPYGTAERDALNELPKTTTITVNLGKPYPVNLNWSVYKYNGLVANDYSATATFELPAIVSQSDPATPLLLTSIITVVEAEKVQPPAQETVKKETKPPAVPRTGGLPAALIAGIVLLSAGVLVRKSRKVTRG